MVLGVQTVDRGQRARQATSALVSVVMLWLAPSGFVAPKCIDYGGPRERRRICAICSGTLRLTGLGSRRVYGAWN